MYGESAFRRYDVKRCACLGTGWFDRGPSCSEVWVRCPFHDTKGTDPRVDFEAYLAHCDVVAVEVLSM